MVSSDLYVDWDREVPSGVPNREVGDEEGVRGRWELGSEREKYLYSIGLNSNELGLKLKF